MDYKWTKIIALDFAIWAATTHVVTNNVFPYNVLGGAVGTIGIVAAHNWALDHFEALPAE